MTPERKSRKNEKKYEDASGEEKMKMRERSRQVQTVNRHHHFFVYLFFFLPFLKSFLLLYKKKKYLTLLIFEKSTCNIAIRNFFTCSFILFCFTSLLNRTCLSDWRWACLERGRHLLSFISTKLRWKLFTCRLCSDFYFAQTWDDYYFFFFLYVLALFPFFLFISFIFILWSYFSFDFKNEIWGEKFDDFAESLEHIWNIKTVLFLLRKYKLWIESKIL